MNLTQNPKAAELLRHAATRNDKTHGLWIAYFEGDFSSNVNQTAVGKVAYELSQQGYVKIAQKLISKEPRTYQYLAKVL